MAFTHFLYHRGCIDGLGAAYSYWRKEGRNATFFKAVNYNDDPMLVLSLVGKEDNVIVADFCYSYEVFQKLREWCQGEITVLDHHLSRREDFKKAAETLGVKGVFDIEHSGAMIAWNYFHPGIEAPLLIKIVEDRDMWWFKIPETKAVTAALWSYPLDFERWFNFESRIPDLVFEGNVLLRAQDSTISFMVKRAFKFQLGEYEIPIVNSPNMRSEIAQALVESDKKIPFAACYWEDETTRHWSLRSREGGVDVSKVAEKYLNGGGHAAAAGGSSTSLITLKEFSEITQAMALEERVSG